MKRILSSVLIIVIVLSLFTACNSDSNSTDSAAQEQNDNIRTLCFADYTKSGKAKATFFNSKSGEKKNVKMKKTAEDEDSTAFSCEADCSVYNMAYVTCGKKKSDEFAFNKCVIGWCMTDDGVFPYIDGNDKNYTPEINTVTLKDIDGNDKNIYVWTPDDYDASSDERYSTVYVLDGQLMLYLGLDYVKIEGCYDVTAQVRAMTKATSKKAIVVGIDNGYERDNELTPRIGELRFEGSFGEDEEYKGMNGIELADFIADTLVPYVHEHYNVFTDREHTSVVGASLGGMESFYIALEHPDIFGASGALSPSFWAFKDEAWEEYVSKKEFSSQSPFLYFFTGNPDYDVGPFTEEMYERLKKAGYPEDKLAFHYDDKASHSAKVWRSVFSEFLTAAFFGEIEPLQKSE